jgi:hypothetical protein
MRFGGLRGRSYHACDRGEDKNGVFKNGYKDLMEATDAQGH